MRPPLRRSWIGGVEISGGDPRPNVNPSDTRDIVSEFELAGGSAVLAAVDAARSAAEQWGRSSTAERARVLDQAGGEVLARAEDLGDTLAREEGKTLPEAVAEVQRAGHILKFHAGEAIRSSGEAVRSVRPDVDVSVTPEPVGVVATITPWNFPMAIPAWKIGPALAHGNTVVFKPASLVTESAWLLVDILHRAGLPPGVLNLVLASGSDVGDAIAGHRDIDAVSFTGSTDVGQTILAAAQRHGARVQLEMGGKNPLLVAADADLEVAVTCAIQGAYFSTGQRCTASSRLIVVDRVYDEFVGRLTAGLNRLVVEDARRPGTDIGPMVDSSQLRTVVEALASASMDGATVIGGRPLERTSPGWYLEPAIVLDTSNDDPLNRSEVFGPVAAVIRAADYDEGLALANDTEFGLTAGICTRSLAVAAHFRDHSNAGLVMVNLPTAGVDYHVPFGGRRASSFGPREQGSAARHFYTVTKTTYTSLRLGRGDPGLE